MTETDDTWWVTCPACKGNGAPTGDGSGWDGANYHSPGCLACGGDCAVEMGVGLAMCVLQLADTASMPDSFWQTDSRVALARQRLGIPVESRYAASYTWWGEHGHQAD